MKTMDSARSNTKYENMKEIRYMRKLGLAVLHWKWYTRVIPEVILHK
jgi:hypothetical protein